VIFWKIVGVFQDVTQTSPAAAEEEMEESEDTYVPAFVGLWDGRREVTTW
jgi:hypothetical protein